MSDPKVTKNDKGQRVFTTEDKRQFLLSDNEEPCRFGCETVIDTTDGDGLHGHCGMCCPQAQSMRHARVEPIQKAAMERAEKEGKERVARAEARAKEASEQRINEMAEAMRRAQPSVVVSQ